MAFLFFFFLAVYVIFDLALYEFFAVFAGYKHLNAGMNWKLSVCRNLLYGFLVIENFVVSAICAGKVCMINV